MFPEQAGDAPRGDTAPSVGRVLALADDLSGAAETAAVLAPGARGRPPRILLGPGDFVPPGPGETLVVDLDTRRLVPAEAARAVAAAVASAAAGTLLLKKIDSLLRGNLATETAAYARGAAGLVIAPALPVAGRTVRDGVVHLRGTPLHETGAWRAEPRPAPPSVAAALATTPTSLVPLTAVRTPVAVLTEHLRTLIATGHHPICDAETDADLDAIAAAALRLGPGVRLMGTGGLAAAVGRALAAGPAVPGATPLGPAPDTRPSAPADGPTPKTACGAGPAPGPVLAVRAPGVSSAGAGAGVGVAGEVAPDAGPVPSAAPAAPRAAPPGAVSDAPSPGPARTDGRPLLVVVGTAEPAAVAQIAQLVATGARHLPLSAEALAAPGSRVPFGLAPGGITVVSVDRAHGLRTGAARQIVAGLARAVAGAWTGPGAPADLVLTGGETARSVLDALGITRLTPAGQIHHGAVRSRADDGRTVVTRPGSYGDTGSLLLIARALRPGGPPRDGRTVRPVTRSARRVPVNAAPTTAAGQPAGTPVPPLPVIAVTMGDGAGIGPEVIVPALLHPDTAARCRPVVVGDARRLRQAAALLSRDCEIVPVEAPAEAEFTPGRINVIDLGLLPVDLPWGRLSAVAGDAAYQYVRVAAELAVSGAVHGICTAPLNKEALHAAGHLYPGHTELLAHLTGVEEVSMMLSTPKVKVIHVTTHIGLIDAVRRIEPGLVERTVRRGHEAMVRAGVPAPVIGVCGINPHAGENGLFGYGEEDEKIVPAVETLRADGIDAVGPLPADTAFFLASRGDYDLIVAMYHDQGHGPVKVMGIEAGVNLTVGLPVIRTSVDHGTAFDIAGTGRAEAGSMVEALRQAAEMATAPVH